VISYSAAAVAAFRRWLEDRHGTIERLNEAWGNVFWSMEYRHFGEVDLPHLTVTEANPAHVLDFRRFSSDQVCGFNAEQVALLRRHSPGRDITHNFMGFFTGFDHHALGEDLDVATWDSYPLGFLEQFWFSEAERLGYARQGHPDIAAFHHDLYRGCSRGRWWVMEQQPGPVNWATWNPAPLAGMVRLWTLEAMAHGAEVVSYFRWRQAPFAQEQMHAGLLRPDRSEDVATAEVRRCAAEIDVLGAVGPPPRSVALVFDYASQWVTEAQPQGRGFSALQLAFEMYSACRRQGLDVDIIPPTAEITGYAAVLVPCLPLLPPGFVARVAAFPGPVLFGPRTGSKTGHFSIPASLPPGELQALLPLRVVRVESLRDGLVEAGAGCRLRRWLEHVETAIPAEFTLADGRGAVFRAGRHRYLAGWPDEALADRLVTLMAAEAGLETACLPEGVRLRRTARYLFAFNYANGRREVPAAAVVGDPVIGQQSLGPAELAVWRRS
jgi:beta-galactosidase